MSNHKADQLLLHRYMTGEKLTDQELDRLEEIIALISDKAKREAQGPITLTLNADDLGITEAEMPKALKHVQDIIEEFGYDAKVTTEEG